MSKRRDTASLISHFLLAFLPLCLLIAAAFAGHTYQRNHDLLARARLDAQSSIEGAFVRTVTRLRTMVADLGMLARSDEVVAVASGDASSEPLATLFTLIAGERGNYEQIRLVNAEGQVLQSIRFDGREAYPEALSEGRQFDDALFLQHSLSMRPRATYISAFHRWSQLPGEAPTLLSIPFLFGTPVVDSEGRVLAALVLAVRASAVLEDLQLQWKKGGGLPYLLNDKGMLVEGVSAAASSEASSMLKFADLAEPVMASAEGQFLDEAGLFTFRNLTSADIQRSGIGDVYLATSGRDAIAHGGYLKLLAYLPRSAMAESSALSFFNVLALAVAVLVAMVMSVVYARLRWQQIRSDRHVRMAAHVEEITRDGVVIYDADRHIESVNPAFTMLTGMLPHEVVGKSAEAFRAMSVTGDKDAGDSLFARADACDSVTAEVYCSSTSGTRFAAFTTLSALRSVSGRIENYIEIFSDISRAKEKESRLVRQAYYDALTEVPNRLLFSDRLRLAISNARRRQEKFALIYIDLDGFKDVNDRYGHEAGDQVLRTVSQRLVSCLRDSDTVARLGGDEFVVIANNISSVGDIEPLVSKIDDTVAKPMSFEGNVLTLSASIGISIYPDDGTNMSALTKVADINMYRHKAQHKAKALLENIPRH